MTERIPKYDQYLGGEQPIDTGALDDLGAQLRLDGLIESSDEGDRLKIQRWRDGSLASTALSLAEITYLLSGQDISRPRSGPEQNRIETMDALEAVVSKYPVELFTALCPRPLQQAISPEPATNWLGWPKRKQIEPQPANNISKTQLVVDGIIYNVTVEYTSAVHDVAKTATIWFGSAKFILDFGPSGVISCIRVAGLTPSIGESLDYNYFEAVRTARTGQQADIAATIAMLDSEITQHLGGFVTFRLGYNPELSFTVYDRVKDIKAVYAAETNDFTAQRGKKDIVKHIIPADTAVKALDEILSTLPIDPIIAEDLHNGDTLR